MLISVLVCVNSARKRYPCTARILFPVPPRHVVGGILVSSFISRDKLRLFWWARCWLRGSLFKMTLSLNGFDGPYTHNCSICYIIYSIYIGRHKCWQTDVTQHLDRYQVAKLTTYMSPTHEPLQERDNVAVSQILYNSTVFFCFVFFFVIYW